MNETLVPPLILSCHAHKANLSSFSRQSKLSPSQLDELQKATHFDKKELQQWYKGVCWSGFHRQENASLVNQFMLVGDRFPQGLSFGDVDQGGVPKDLSTVFPLWRPVVVCQLCLPGIRCG